MVEWAAEHIDIVHVMVFIAFRQAVPQIPMDWYAGGKKIDMGELVYFLVEQRKVDIVDRRRVGDWQAVPQFSPCGSLNGTESRIRWMALSTRAGSKEKIFGYMGKKFIEFVQTQTHLRHGKYLAYGSPSTLETGRSGPVAGSLLDTAARRAFGSGLGWLINTASDL